jgi:hypothetical protein
MALCLTGPPHGNGVPLFHAAVSLFIFTSRQTRVYPSTSIIERDVQYDSQIRKRDGNTANDAL